VGRNSLAKPEPSKDELCHGFCNKNLQIIQPKEKELRRKQIKSKAQS